MLTLAGCGGSGEVAGDKTIAVVAKGESHAFWQSVKAGAVAQDSFQIGYQAVEQAVFALEGKEVTEKVDISGAWWNATNVDEMIEKNLVYQG